MWFECSDDVVASKIAHHSKGEEGVFYLID